MRPRLQMRIAAQRHPDSGVKTLSIFPGFFPRNRENIGAPAPCLAIIYRWPTAVAGAEDSALFVPRREECEFLGGRFPAENFIAVRKAAEPLDDLDIGASVTAQRTATVALALRAVEQSHRAALVGEVLAMVKRHVEKPPPRLGNQPVEPAGERPVGGGTRDRVGGVGARLVAKDVARDLVEQQHQGERALGQRFPRPQLAGRTGFVIGEKSRAQGGVEFRSALEPDVAVPLADGVAGWPEPGIEKRLRPLRKIAVGHFSPLSPSSSSRRARNANRSRHASRLRSGERSKKDGWNIGRVGIGAESPGISRSNQRPRRRVMPWPPG